MRERIEELGDQLAQAIINVIWWASAHPYLAVIATLGVYLLPSSWGFMPSFGISEGARSELGAGLLTGVVIATALQRAEDSRREQLTYDLWLLPQQSRFRVAHVIIRGYRDSVADVRQQWKATKTTPLLDLQGRAWSSADLASLEFALDQAARGGFDPYSLGDASRGAYPLLLVEAAHELLESIEFQTPPIAFPYPWERHTERLKKAVSVCNDHLHRASDHLAAHAEPRRARGMLAIGADISDLLTATSFEGMWGVRLLEACYGTGPVDAVRRAARQYGSDPDNWTRVDQGARLKAWIEHINQLA